MCDFFGIFIHICPYCRVLCLLLVQKNCRESSNRKKSRLIKTCYGLALKTRLAKKSWYLDSFLTERDTVELFHVQRKL